MAGKDHEINMHEIYTIPNSGYSKDQVTHNNACIWISIQDYLLYFTERKMTVSELKRIAELLPQHHENYEFDFETHGHNLEILANRLGLCVKVYPVQNGMLDKRRVFTFGKCNGEDNIVDIISYGAHFELMVLDKNFVDEDLLKYFKKYIPKIIGFNGKYEKDTDIDIELQKTLYKSLQEPGGASKSTMLRFAKLFREPGGASKPTVPGYVKLREPSRASKPAVPGYVKLFREPGGASKPTVPIEEHSHIPHLRRAIEESRTEEEQMRRAIEESRTEEEELHRAIEESRTEEEQMRHAIEKSHKSVNVQFLKLSHELTELTNKINNQRFNINGFRRAIGSGKLNERNTIEYETILENLNEELKLLQSEKKEIEKAMDKLHQYVQFGGKKYDEIYNKQKYLKYKNKYIQLKKHNIKDLELQAYRKK